MIEIKKEEIPSFFITRNFAWKIISMNYKKKIFLWKSGEWKIFDAWRVGALSDFVEFYEL
jgi:hypothetical protein